MKKTVRKPKYTWSPIFLLLLILIPLLVIIVSFVSNNSFDTRGRAAVNNSSGFVTTSGTKFMLDGKEFRFVGFNLFDAANTFFPEQGKQGYSCPRDSGWWTNIYTEADLEKEMVYMKEQSGSSVLRFWAFQKYTNGGTDWSGIDKVIRVAKKTGFKLLPVLEDGPGYCTYPEPAGNAKWKYNGDTWYTEGYKQKMGNNTLTYPEYVRAIVTRYKDEPTIMAWMMVNEADTSRKVDGVDGTGKSALVGFAKDIGTLIKSIDSNHLLTVGTQSNGASGASGSDFLDVYGVKGAQGRDLIDFTEIHDWPFWGGDTDPLPGSPDGKTLPNPNSPDCIKTYQSKLACSIANSIQKLQKPILMGEAGIAARNNTDRTRRADLMDKKMNAFFNAGGSGYLVWQWNKVIDGEGFDVQMATTDPLLAKMKQYAGTIVVPKPSIATPVPTRPLPTGALPTGVPSIRPTVLPTKLPTTKPTVTRIPTKIPVTTLMPTKPTTPTPVLPPSTSLEGEQLRITPGQGSVYSDGKAHNGQAVVLDANTIATGTLTGPIRFLTIRARADQCFGNPHINVKINGTYVLDTNITSKEFLYYKSNSLAYIGLGTGQHTVEVIYNNDYKNIFCNRNVRIDVIRAE